MSKRRSYSHKPPEKYNKKTLDKKLRWSKKQLRRNTPSSTEKKWIVGAQTNLKGHNPITRDLKDKLVVKGMLSEVADQYLRQG